MIHDELIPHLFRTEFARITAVLAKLFGAGRLELAEDIAGETFLAAMETWPYRGVPAHPAAWLYRVARNKAITHLRRDALFAHSIAPRLKAGESTTGLPEIDLSASHIADSQLQMLFAVCHPSISGEAQVALALRVLCGFGIDEIANAFLINRETIKKRLARARQTLRDEQITIEMPGPDEVSCRLDTVLTTLYLVYSEGCYSESTDTMLREELCLEAMRLTRLLTEHAYTNLPQVKALLALMCFHASRFPSRRSGNGEMILYDEQDASLWNRDLITQGVRLLHAASRGTQLSKYHIEASIAYWHTVEESPDKWESILQLYNQLLCVQYSPVAALNRAFAVWKVQGPQCAIDAAIGLPLNGYRYYHVLLGELYSGVDDMKARFHLQEALRLAISPADQVLLQRRLGLL